MAGLGHLHSKQANRLIELCFFLKFKEQIAINVEKNYSQLTFLPEHKLFIEPYRVESLSEIFWIMMSLHHDGIETSRFGKALQNK